MSKNLYILANLKIDADNEDPWMCSFPLIQIDHNDYISLQLIQDLHLNFMLKKNDLIKMTMYKITITKNNEFSNKRHELLKSNNFSDNNISNFGFIKVKDFTYVVNPTEKTQYFDDISLTLSYTENKKIPQGMYYIDCPYITMQK